MSSDPYNARVRALFAAPAHAGTCAEGLQVLRDEQGVQIELSARARNGVIKELRFRATACPHVLAACEAFCAEHEGCEVSRLDAFTARDLMQSLAVPVQKSGRILVLEDAVRMLGAAIRNASNPARQY